MLINVSPNPKPDSPERPQSTADELIKAIRLANEEFKTCEIIPVAGMNQAVKFLRNLGYNPVRYQKGVILRFEKAQIYIHE